VTVRIRGTDLSWRELDETVVVLDLKASRYLSLTGTGAFLWRLLAQGTTVDAMTVAVLDEFDVADATARRDVEAFVADLRREGLLA
jgi:hypothetical protein